MRNRPGAGPRQSCFRRLNYPVYQPSDARLGPNYDLLTGTVYNRRKIMSTTMDAPTNRTEKMIRAAIISWT